MNESQTLVHRLLESMTDTIDQLQQLSDADLGRECSHPCAMGGGVRRLLVHNDEHDRQHAAAISNARTSGRAIRESELASLLRDWLRERAELVGQLLTAPDGVLDLAAAGDEWDVREHVEHVLHWERDSIDTAMREVEAARSTATAG